MSALGYGRDEEMATKLKEIVAELNDAIQEAATKHKMTVRVVQRPANMLTPLQVCCVDVHITKSF